MSWRTLSLLVVVNLLVLSVPASSFASAKAPATVVGESSPPRGQDRAALQRAAKDAVQEDPAAPASPSLFGDELVFGVTAPSVPWDRQQIEHVTDLTGERPGLVMWYRGFGDDITAHELDLAATDGTLPLLTWEPYNWTHGIEQPEYTLSRIISGEFDSYLLRNAETLRDWNQPLLLRFAHEMNGDWYPWSEAANGNSPGDYITAWRHIHDLFARAGVTNVSWVWSPNIEYDGSLPLDGLYPGDDYVDVIAIDGYNWGTSAEWHTWQSPAQVFDATLDTVRAIAPGKPLIIGETASSEFGGDKGAWVTELFAWLMATPDIEAFVWFHYDKETDWRIDSSAASAAAFQEGLAAIRASGR